MKYYYYAVVAWIRGFFYPWPKSCKSYLPTISTGLNGKGESKIMFYSHNWIPYIYRYIPYGGINRIFISPDYETESIGRLRW